MAEASEGRVPAAVGACAIDPSATDLGSAVEEALWRILEGPAAGTHSVERGDGADEDLRTAVIARLGAAPGPALAEELSSLELADLDDHTLVEALAAWERVAAWAQGDSARALAELLERTRNTSGHEFVADGVAARLGLSRRAAERHVTVAHGAARLPEVADALAGGLVDRTKADALVSTGRLPDDLRRLAVRDLLPEVEHLTAAQIRARMKRAEIEVDPDGAADRHEAARRERFVRLEPVDDAMAYLTAYLPADDAARAFAAVDDVALAIRRGPGEERRLDECRADAFVGMVAGTIVGSATGTTSQGGGSREEGADGSGRGDGVRPSKAGRRTRGVHVTVAASTLLGADELPATLHRYGPIPASVARAIASDPGAVWERILTDPVSGVLSDTSARTYRPSARLRDAVAARDVTCTFPGCRVPAAGCDLDHVDPYDPTADRPQTHGENLHALCRTHHRAKTLGGWRVSRDPETGVTRWTAPTGHRYDRPPETVVPRRSDPPTRRPGSHPRPDESGPPPF